jgi:transcriptional regulator with XRE-family HTH domain
MSQIATLDELVSVNVRRLRDGAGLSVAQLAARLNVSRAKVYQYEGPRSDGRRHSFKWSEVVELCAALECSVFELVLPDEGDTVEVPEWVARRIEPTQLDGQLGAVRVSPPGREELARLVFHLPGEALTRLPEIRLRLVKEARDFERNLRRRMWDELTAALEQEGEAG